MADFILQRNTFYVALYKIVCLYHNISVYDVYNILTIRRGDLMINSLTTKEVIVLQFLSKGYSNTQIAEKLFVDISTIKNNVKSILLKLNTKNRMQAASIAACILTNQNISKIIY